MKSRILAVYGAGGHGRVVADIAFANGADEVVFIDDGANIHSDFAEFRERYPKDVPVALGIGDNQLRRHVMQKIEKAGYIPAIMIHPDATVSPDAVLEAGSVVMPGAVINSGARIAKGAIVNTGAIVEHDCMIGEFVHLSPRVVLGGGVKVGEMTHMGVGCCVIHGISIGSAAIVGAGAVVTENLDDGITAVGVPARPIKENNE
jgi:UDP-N-acetylbacillosamine N-acetyltransferase